MAESYRAKAFDVFERLGAARNGTPGTGMGLPICKRVVEGVGGTIALDGPQSGFTTATTLRITSPPQPYDGPSTSSRRTHEDQGPARRGR